MVNVMGDRPWLLQDAKAQFSALVDAALNGQPQHVTRRGKAAVVVVSEVEYARLNQSLRASAAPDFIAHLMSMPRGKSQQSLPLEGKRTLKLRDIDFK
jgi:antitoxin Phd